jgi:tetratricopeptide (TPR) repeat protein
LLVSTRIAELLFHFRQFEEAIVAYNQAINLKPDFGPAYFARGKAYDACAFQDYKKARYLKLKRKNLRGKMS